MKDLQRFSQHVLYQLDSIATDSPSNPELGPVTRVSRKREVCILQSAEPEAEYGLERRRRDSTIQGGL